MPKYKVYLEFADEVEATDKMEAFDKVMDQITSGLTDASDICIIEKRGLSNEFV